MLIISRIQVIGSIVGIVAVIIIATVVGVVVTNNNKKSNKNLNSGSTTSTANPNSSVQQTDPNDPSKFTLDKNLHKAFYGMAYTPVGSQLPDCGNSLCEFVHIILEIAGSHDSLILVSCSCCHSGHTSAYS